MAAERSARALPPVERRARRWASRYVAGETDDDAVRVARALAGRGVSSSIDHFGEQVTDAPTAELVGEDYCRLATRAATVGEGVWLAVDLSHLGLDVDPTACARRLVAIAERLPSGHRVQVGAEDSDRAPAVLACVLSAAAQGHESKLGATIQANLHRSTDDLERLIDAGVHVRLVKGAYVEPSSRALPHGEATDAAFVRLAHRLAERDAAFALATHDQVLRDGLLDALGPRPVEQLLGVAPANLDSLVARDVPVRVYIPYGRDWFRYWMRRLAESRGA